ncbi:MAG: hypothetical protein WD604_13135 [Balneolaceae bacterium]
MARIHFLIISLVTLFAIVPLNNISAQQTNYEFIPAPDLWYNDVDGIRAGIRLQGQVPGTFEDGPHRLDAGFWLSTWFPSLPVSYYLSFTEPIRDWSEYGSEASGRLLSSVRTGYHIHGFELNKRWQQGFDERRYRETGWLNTFEKRFDDEYTAFPVLWSDAGKIISKASFELQDDNPLGWYNIRTTAAYQFLDRGYGYVTASALQRAPLNDNWGFRFRIFSGIASADTDPEYLFPRSSSPAVNWMESGLTRAKGTIPTNWITDGNFQVAGGANLRGYTNQDAAIFTGTELPADAMLLNSVLSFNTEFDYFNPINLLFEKIPYASDFLSFRSYLFFDAGTSLQVDDNDPDTIFSDAGAGFSLSLNIPDYLGKPRGFVLRYELPFWLSEPGEEDNLKLRHLFAAGAVISF